VGRRRALALVVVWAWHQYDLGAADAGQPQGQPRRPAGTGARPARWPRPLAFFAIYVAATALSLPGAVILTLAAGAMFGLGWGLLLVSFASSLGALLAFLAARYLLRDGIQRASASGWRPSTKACASDGVVPADACAWCRSFRSG
jgi:hypothetical protein